MVKLAVKLIGLVTNRGARFPFLVCCLERGVSCVIAEDPTLQNTSQFMFTPTSLGALLLSMQYKSQMGLSPPEWESGM